MQEHTVASAARPHPEVVLEGIEAPPLDRIPPTVALDPQNIAIPTPGVYPDGCVLAPSLGASGTVSHSPLVNAFRYCGVKGLGKCEYSRRLTGETYCVRWLT